MKALQHLKTFNRLEGLSKIVAYGLFLPVFLIISGCKASEISKTQYAVYSEDAGSYAKRTLMDEINRTGQITFKIGYKDSSGKKLSFKLTETQLSDIQKMILNSVEAWASTLIGEPGWNQTNIKVLFEQGVNSECSPNKNAWRCPSYGNKINVIFDSGTDRSYGEELSKILILSPRDLMNVQKPEQFSKQAEMIILYELGNIWMMTETYPQKEHTSLLHPPDEMTNRIDTQSGLTADDIAASKTIWNRMKNNSLSNNKAKKP